MARTYCRRLLNDNDNIEISAVEGSPLRSSPCQSVSWQWVIRRGACRRLGDHVYPDLFAKLQHVNNQQVISDGNSSRLKYCIDFEPLFK